jgi:hypothetical protein
MFFDKATLSPVSNTHKIVMQSNCNSSRKECLSNTDEDAFYSQSNTGSVGLYLFPTHKIKMVWQSDTDFLRDNSLLKTNPW